MARKIVLLAFLFFAIAEVWPQGNYSSRIPLLGEKAPAFTAQSTTGDIEFPGNTGRSWKILFSHPADFTPVCTSELMELALMQQDFKDLNCDIFVISTDALERHKLWVSSIESLASKDNHPVKIDFPLIDDSKLNIGWKYGMLTPWQGSFHAVRGVFIVDPQNNIKGINFYPTDVGRNLDEIKRTIIAMQTAQKNNVLTPVNWEPGQAVLLPYPTSVDLYDPLKEKEDGVYQLSGYMIYKELDKKNNDQHKAPK